nr:hypothetical protein B0A51_13920 [Rachicladosporium sp. CCFEE 5018]
MLSSLILTASLLTASNFAQFVPAPTDLITKVGYYNQHVRYKEVPEGICELTPGVKSFSGYVNVAAEQEIFFWFFEARNEDPSKAPLTVWINGGPGSSSMIGLFEELGPCSISADGEVVNNPYAWNNASNMLFIDHPAQVGFSYSKPVSAYVDSRSGSIVTLPDASCPDYATGVCGTFSYPNETDTANSTQGAAPSMWKMLQGFMGAFPQYSRNEFNFATESYGGHYGPVFNEYIETQNALIRRGQLPGAQQISLSTVLIGNGWYDPLIQYQAYYNFTVSPGNTYDYSPYNQSIQNQVYNALYGEGNCYDQTVYCYKSGINSICAAADNFCANNVEAVLDNIPGRDEYDIRELAPDPFPYSYWRPYLNSEKVQKALGAFVNYTSDGGNTVYNAFVNTGDDDRESGTIEACRALVSQGVYVVQFAGDADYNCNWLGGQAVAEEIDAPGFCNAGYVDMKTSDHITHGQVKQSANFAFARIYESGHEVPFYQPLAALELFERGIGRKDIATGKYDVRRGYITKGTPESTYREGNRTVQFTVLPDDAIYNTTLNAPNPTGNVTAKAKRDVRGWKPTRSTQSPLMRRSLGARLGVKPRV